MLRVFSSEKHLSRTKTLHIKNVNLCSVQHVRMSSVLMERNIPSAAESMMFLCQPVQPEKPVEILIGVVKYQNRSFLKTS